MTAPPPASAWSPLRRPLFRNLWIADVASNIGTWMHDAAAAWLMTLLAPSPLLVSLVQAATTLPLFLLALPAGALADIFDRRRILLIAQVWWFLTTAVLGVLTITGVIQPWMLLVITLAIGAGSAIDLPAWQAIIPETVPREELPAAVGLGSIAINIARATGPALAGVIIVAGGPGPVFFVNAVSVLGVFFVLWRWRRKPVRATLPAERLASAMRAGVRYVRFAPALRTVVVRTAAFVGFASALWALLPLVVKVSLSRGPVSYGALVGSLGLGGLLGASLLPTWRKRWSTDAITAVATAAFALGCLSLAWVTAFPLLIGAMVIAGAGWLTTLSSLILAAQRGAAEWVRGRALSISTLTLFGSLAIGALLWGIVATRAGTQWALTGAGIALLLGLGLIPRFRLATAEADNLEHSQNWPDPVVAGNLDAEAGPVLVTVEYIVQVDQRAAFVDAMRSQLRPIRSRDGAVFWELFVDSADPRRCVECWLVESWAEHLRQHDRTTQSDRDVEERIRALVVGRERTTHYIALSPTGESTA
ncbi:MAG: MFS transporter [Gemmatimonadetes bacterium]|nr:MAG: MFS transporter [Gemmatimonadota bacterium]